MDRKDAHNVIIKELYIDHFLNDDLTLADLSDQLNVIRVPSQNETKFLHTFIPSMLYGDSRVRGEMDRSTSGSARIQIGSEHFELLRIAEGEKAGLHVLNEQGETADVPLNDWLRQLSRETYLSVFTDHWLVADRLKHWRTTGLIDVFADDDLGQPESSSSIDDSSLMTEIRGLKEQVKRLIDQRSKILVDLASGPDQRDTYLKARAKVSQAEQCVGQLSSQLERSQQQILPIELALQLVEPWQRHSKLKARVAELRALRVRPKDLSRLKRVERRLSEARVQLRELREQADEPRAPEPEVQRFDVEAQRLLAQREEVLQRCRRRAELQQELVDASQVEQEDRAHVGDAVRQVDDAAGRLREARRRFRAASEQARQIVSEDARDESAEAPAGDVESQSVEELRERIKQLKAETHQLLKRRLLPPLIVLILGVVFAIGAACLMAALLLDLNDFDSSVGAVGVTVMLAAALLKLSFERTPEVQLRIHRQRIQQLLHEVQQRDPVRQAATDDSISIPMHDAIGPDITPLTDVVEKEPPKVDPLLRQELEDAYQDWVMLLGQYDLDPEIDPRDAVAEVRRRHDEQSNLRPDESNTLHLECDEHDRWLERYRESLVAFLAERNRRRAHEPLGVDDASWETLFSLLEFERDTAQDPSGPTAARPSPQQIADIQCQIKEAKQLRDKVLQRTSAKNVDDLKSRLERKKQLSRLETELRRAQRKISSELSEVTFAADVQRLLDATSDVDLKKQHKGKQAEIKRLKAQLQRARSELQDARDSVGKLTQDQSRIDLRLQMNLLDEQLAELAGQLRVAQVSRQTVQRLQPVKAGDRKPSALLLEANRLLQNARELPCRLFYDHDRQQFLLQFVDEVESVMPVQELGRNETELIVMCLQLALMRQFDVEAGIKLPLVLHERSLGYPAEHALIMGRLLSEVANEGRQVFLFSCHQAVSDLFSRLRIPTLVVQRTVADEPGAADLDSFEGQSIQDAVEVKLGAGSLASTRSVQPVALESAPVEPVTDEPEPLDWIPVEYHVVEPRDVEKPAAPEKSDPTVSEELSTRLEQIGSSESSKPKRFRIDRSHQDQLIRPPAPRRWTVSAGDAELPEWWPD